MADELYPEADSVYDLPLPYDDFDEDESIYHSELDPVEDEDDNYQEEKDSYDFPESWDLWSELS